MKKPKKSTKILFVTISMFLVLGIAFATIGFLSGISNWYVLEGNSIKTSNMVKAIEENKEVEAFTSIDLECPFQVVNITQGENFSVKYTSHQYSVAPEVTVSDGVLKIGNKINNEKIAINWQSITSFDKHFADNTITITIPKGSVLESIKIDSTKNLPTEYSSYSVNGETINISDVETNNLKIVEKISNGRYLCKVISNCVIGTASLENAKDCRIVDSKIGKLAVVNLYDNLNGRSQIGNYEVKNSTIEALETNNENSGAYESLSMVFERSKIFSAIGLFDKFSANDCELANIKINAGAIKITNSALTGENDLKANGNIFVNSAQQSSDLNCQISRAITDVNAVTEIVNYDDPRYMYGYISYATKAMGEKAINISEKEYDNIRNNFSQQGEIDDERYYTTQESDDYSKKEKSKFDEYIKIEHEYDNDSNQQIFKLTVYEKKAITYTVNSDGYVSYVDLRGNMSDKDYLSIGIDKSLSDLKKSKPANSKNSLKCYSDNGYVSVDFAGNQG